MTEPDSILGPRHLWQSWITREDVRANRDVIYVFGDNAAREGRRGLARHLRHEPNAHAISISQGPFEPYTHSDLEAAKAHIDADLQALEARRATLIVWPSNGLFEPFIEAPQGIRDYLQQEILLRFQIKVAA